MTAIRLRGSLPKGDANGVDHIAPDLIADPHRFKVLMMIVDCSGVAMNYDTGENVPTARIRRIEAVSPADLKFAEQIMRRALEARTGRVVLPLDMEDEVRLAFGQVDPRTGEKSDGDESRG